jgi:hypothetical protein
MQKFLDHIVLFLNFTFSEENPEVLKQLLDAGVGKKLLSLTFDQKFQQPVSPELDSIQLNMSCLLLQISEYLRNADVAASEFNDLMFVVLELVEVETEQVLANLTQALYQLLRYNREHYSKFSMPEKVGIF